MKKRIFAAILSVLLAVSLMLCLPVSAKAASWEDTIAQYDALFAVIDGEPEMKFHTLYTALLLDPETFINQLAFRDKETKEYVLYILTGDWVSPEQWLNIKDALDSAETDFEAEKLIVRDIKDYWSFLSYQDVGIVTDCKALFDKALTADGFYATDLAYNLAYAFIGTPETFIFELLEEEEEVQRRVLLLLQEHQYSFLGAKIYESIPEYTGTDPNVINIISVLTSTTENHPCIYPQEDPDPEALKQWKEAGLTPPVFTAYNYDQLFDFSLGEHPATLAEALLNDTSNFVNELAFRDIDTKNNVMRTFEDAYFQYFYVKRMYLTLLSYKESAILTESETDFLETMTVRLDCLYYRQSHPHRDLSTLFAAAKDVPDTRWETFTDEVKFAFRNDPKAFIAQLVQEEEAVQEQITTALMAYTDGNPRFHFVGEQIEREYGLWATTPESYTEEEAQLLVSLKLAMPPFVYGPVFANPHTAEYQKWLEDKGLLVDDPGVVLPIYPTETQPVTLPTETVPAEETIPAPAGKGTEKDIGWITTVCFALGFLCIGIATGSMIAKQKKAKKAKLAEQQAAAEVPVKIYPKLLYCPAPLSRETQKQISQLLREKYDEYSIHWYSIKQPDGTCRCYGTEGGYDIIFYAGGLRMEIPDSCTVGQCTFHHGTSFELYAHKDGQLLDLDAALAQGLVSLQAVQESHKKHQSLAK